MGQGGKERSRPTWLFLLFRSLDELMGDEDDDSAETKGVETRRFSSGTSNATFCSSSVSIDFWSLPFKIEIKQSSVHLPQTLGLCQKLFSCISGSVPRRRLSSSLPLKVPFPPPPPPPSPATSVSAAPRSARRSRAQSSPLR